MPNKNVQLEYSQIDTVSSQLNNAVSNINPQLLTLKNSVDSLLNDGLFLQQTSPAMQHAYEQFTTQLQQIVTKIGDFAKSSPTSRRRSTTWTPPWRTRSSRAADTAAAPRTARTRRRAPRSAAPFVVSRAVSPRRPPARSPAPGR